LQEKASVAQVSQLYSSLGSLQGEVGHLQQDFQATASAQQFCDLEKLLSQCKSQMEEVQQDKLGKEHLQQLGSFAMRIQRQISDMVTEIHDQSSAVDELKVNLSTIGTGVVQAVDRLSNVEDQGSETTNLLTALQQELQEKAGINDLHHLDSTLRRRLANCDQAIEDKAVSLQQLKSTITMLQDNAAKLTTTSTEAVNGIQDLSNSMTQVTTGMEKASAELQRLRHAESEIVARIAN